MKTLVCGHSRRHLVLGIILIWATIEIGAVETIFVGGTAGIENLANPENSDEYRSAGGGVYLHHSGWAPLEAEIKTQIQDVFAGHDYTLELGHLTEDYTTWQNAYVKFYKNRGIRPAYITCNAFSKDRIPSVTDWEQTIAAYRGAGVPETTKIFATFEYQNFASRIPTLASNKVSIRDDFQQIIALSGGIVIDAPSMVFFRREQNYRDWIVDAIQWTRANGYTTAIIYSPHAAGEQYDEYTLDYIDYLLERDALPDLSFVENYAASTVDFDTYPNPVGNEDTPHHQLGMARILQEVLSTIGDFDGDGLNFADEKAEGRNPHEASDMGFEFNVDSLKWEQQNNLDFVVENGYLSGTSITADPQIIRTGLSFEGVAVSTIHVKLRASLDGNVQFFWGHTAADNSSPTRRLDLAYTGGGDWQVIEIPLGEAVGSDLWNEQTITRIRIDPTTRVDVQWAIDWIRASNGDRDLDGLADKDEGFPFRDTDGDGWEDWWDRDSDNDGASDALEASFERDPYNNKDFRVDSDGDGYTDLFEMLSGSDPDEPSDNMDAGYTIMPMGENIKVMVDINVRSGHNYRLWRSATLAPDSWQLVGERSPINDSRIQITDTTATTPTFYTIQASLSKE